MLRRDRRRLDISGDSQLSRIKTEQGLPFFVISPVFEGYGLPRRSEL